MYQKIVLNSRGSVDHLQLQVFAPQELKEDEVAVRVKYSGINFADLMMRLGLYPEAPPLPFTPGYEFSGVVSAVGSEVKHLRPEDRVYGATRFGGYSSYLHCPAHYLARLPEGLSLAEGAALPVNYATSFFALHEQARMRAEDEVLVDCASGGVGSIALQMIRAVGARGTGLTSSAEKKDFIRKLGAQALTHDEFSRGRKKFDIIVNSQGGETILAHFHRLRPTGRLLCLGASQMVVEGWRRYLKVLQTVWHMPRFSMMKLFNTNGGVFGLNVLKLLEHPEFIERALQSLCDTQGQIRPHLDRIFPAERVGEAHQYLEAKKARGKVLLSWGDE